MICNTNDHNKGFIALISVVIISSALIVMTLLASQQISTLYDEVNHKEYRIQATEAALYCFSQVLLELEHDYFYTVSTTTSITRTQHAVEYCSIISVASAQPGQNYLSLNNPGNLRNIIVTGTSKNREVAARILAQVLINATNISLISSAVTF